MYISIPLLEAKHPEIRLLNNGLLLSHIFESHAMRVFELNEVRLPMNDPRFETTIDYFHCIDKYVYLPSKKQRFYLLKLKQLQRLLLFLKTVLRSGIRPCKLLSIISRAVAPIT